MDRAAILDYAKLDYGILGLTGMFRRRTWCTRAYQDVPGYGTRGINDK